MSHNEQCEKKFNTVDHAELIGRR